MRRRIFGLETEFGISCMLGAQRRLAPEEAARYLFRRVVAWGKSSNVFLRNGSRLYLDVGSHPEYATAECDQLTDLIAQDQAGLRILEDLAQHAQQQLSDEGIGGEIYLYKNNTDSVGNSYGCHENYLVERGGDFNRLADTLLPFLLTRQLIAGAGNVLRTPQGARYCLSQRADHIWEGLSSATTRARPIINTRDEPHADPERYRRLHIIVGDSNMCQRTTWLKVGSCALVLDALAAGGRLPDRVFDNPVRAIREISHDLTGRKPLALAAGGTITALAVQTDYLELVTNHLAQHGGTAQDHHIVQLWEQVLAAIATEDFTAVDTDIDWIIKRKLIDAYASRHQLPLSDARIAQVNLAYHDIRPGRGIFSVLAGRNQASTVIDEAEVVTAVTEAPGTTRAALRSRFLLAAQQAGRDYSVDWVHLKVNDAAQRTVLLRDPYASSDERVDRLIESMSS